MNQPSSGQADLREGRVARIGQATKVHVLHVSATWAVRAALDSGYRLVVGGVPPTARDRDVPLRKILAWAVLSAAAMAATSVVVDRLALRPELTPPDRPLT